MVFASKQRVCCSDSMLRKTASASKVASPRSRVKCRSARRLNGLEEQTAALRIRVPIEVGAGGFSTFLGGTPPATWGRLREQGRRRKVPLAPCKAKRRSSSWCWPWLPAALGRLPQPPQAIPPRRSVDPARPIRTAPIRTSATGTIRAASARRSAHRTPIAVRTAHVPPRRSASRLARRTRTASVRGMLAWARPRTPIAISPRRTRSTERRRSTPPWPADSCRGGSDTVRTCGSCSSRTASAWPTRSGPRCAPAP